MRLSGIIWHLVGLSIGIIGLLDFNIEVIALGGIIVLLNFIDENLKLLLEVLK